MADPALAMKAAAPSRYDGFDKMLLNGAWRQGSSGQFGDDRDPYTNDVLARIPLADERDLDAAFAGAAAAQPKWYAILPGERSVIIRRAAAIMDERRDEIIDWLIAESGSTRIKANVEWQYARAVTLEAATFPSRVEGPILPVDIPAKESRVYRQPVGVVGMISPWNFPFHLSSRSVAPAIAVGNSVVIKPASDTPVTGGTLLAKIYEEAGIPAGVLNVVIGAGQHDRRCLRAPSGAARDFVHRLHRSRPADHGAGGAEPDPQKSVARARRQFALGDSRRCGYGSCRQHRRVRQISAPGADLHGDQPAGGRRQSPRRIRRALRRQGAPAESRQSRTTPTPWSGR